MTQLKWGFAAMAGLFVGMLASAQDHVIVPAPPPPPLSSTIVPDGGFAMAAGSYDMKFVSAEFGMDGKVVKGAPYSAQAVTESTQTLGDGTHITRNMTANLARDGEGRTRREQNFSNIGPWSADNGESSVVFINDVVAGVNYILEPNSHTARKTPGAQAKSIFFSKAAIASSDIKVRTRDVDEAVTNMKLNAELKALGREPGDVKTESLGTQVMEGVKAQGTRTTRTIPAGQIGNDRPIDIVSEVWVSPDLQTIVMSKTTDPRAGETVYKLSNIQRGEPSRTLFEVPADYTLKEESGFTISSSTSGDAQRIRVGGGVQAANLIHKVEPEYPQTALDARIQGTVRFSATVGKDGRVSNLQLIAGHPLLVEAAKAAAQQYLYKPTLLNGAPIEVATQLDVNFTLPQNE